MWDQAIDELQRSLEMKTRLLGNNDRQVASAHPPTPRCSHCPSRRACVSASTPLACRWLPRQPHPHPTWSPLHRSPTSTTSSPRPLPLGCKMPRPPLMPWRRRRTLRQPSQQRWWSLAGHTSPALQPLPSPMLASALLCGCLASTSDLAWLDWNGMGWDGMGWDGMGWDGDGMGWDGMGCNGMDWDGLGWIGLGWAGLGWAWLDLA